MADTILKEWKTRARKGHVNSQGQKVEEVWNVETALIEIIKYGSKIFTEPDLKKRAKETTSSQIYLMALHTIFKAMKGRRIFDSFGFKLPKQAENVISDTQVLSDYKRWEFDLKSNDWVNENTGEVLSDYVMPTQLQAMLENNLNIIAR